MANIIITGVTFGLCAMLAFGIGISQLRSKEPVGFYSGEKPPSKEQLSDVSEWNRKHGIMWIVYGICIVAAWICGLFIGDSIWSLIPLVTGVIVPIIFMIMYHRKLIKMYFVK